MPETRIYMKKVLFALLTIAALAAGSVLWLTRDNDTSSKESASVVDRASVDLATDTTAIEPGPATPSSTETQLVYLIEEEKLAHDVYTKMYELWGANVFGNILESEATHQSRVLELLQARSIADPRSSEIGVFKNAELQKLYNDLIAQGSQSAGEAFKVGVAIEEKDIADITVQLATAKDSDVVSTLEALRRGSENHLRAFNRQLE
jgi:hypothetical protein